MRLISFDFAALAMRHILTGNLRNADENIRNEFPVSFFRCVV